MASAVKQIEYPKVGDSKWRAENDISALKHELYAPTVEISVTKHAHVFDFIGVKEKKLC